MTDRHIGYVVTLDSNIREDDAKDTIQALRMVKGVLDVTPVISALTMDTVVYVMRERDRWKTGLYELIKALCVTSP